MPAVRSLQATERCHIVHLYLSGKSYRKIAGIFEIYYFVQIFDSIFIDEMQISLGCVHYTIKKYKIHGLYNDLPKSGRPKKVTPRIRRSIIKTIVKDPFASPKTIKSALPDNDIISESCIRKNLVNEGYRAYKAKKKPFLTVRHRRLRLDFCNRYGNYDSSFWEKVIFSDETRISLLASDKPPLVRRPINLPLSPQYLRPSFKHAISVMVWGCFSNQGLGELYIVDGNLNNAKYLTILESNLLPFINKIDDHGPHAFQDDNAPPHRHQNVYNWIEKNNILKIEWPPQSPDLNPIENLWHFLKLKVAKYGPTNKAELINTIQRVWKNEIPDELITNLIHSMKNRIESLKKSKGGHIDY